MTAKALALRVLRVLLVLLALGFCAYSLASQWDETVEAFERMSAPTLLGSLAAGCGGLWAWMLAWRVFVQGMGSPLPLRAAFRITAISALGKYVPGKVWALVTQIELSREHEVPAERSFSATMIAVATSMACGLAVAAATLPLTSPAAREKYWWLFLLAPVLLAMLHPKIVTWGINLVLRLARRTPLEKPVSVRATLHAIAWTLVAWALFGVHIWLLCLAVGGSGAGLPFLATGAYALAFVAGFLVFIAPGGLGAREAAMVLVLNPVLPVGAPIVAVASRVLLTVADLIGAGVAVLMGRAAARERRDRAAAAARSDTAGNAAAAPELVPDRQPTKEERA
ncbi:lysylphosphatidylglycerol synthase transmembrane domain-containing protein [Actinomadura parmotrematis]|uniref:Flippase-like domain-containing protein n=1 Tax=Actinomadura parmotrematis TaxID=2864039 RepID=A0ABS7FW05_9ACTN|nr:lysylphosphatidylglycerol synthase transmembrane domain-containing protein [Actinomadura parmotrematis]MBW8484618.1 flippase-like domain-containing protein [Actinomadura parmotrematis]